LSDKKHTVLDERLCKRCNICVAFCPKKVYDARSNAAPKVARPEDCVGCELCVMRCPDFALKLEGGEKQ